MDNYGIGSAASMALHLYESASRRSGRTSRMIAAAGEDDLIVCRTEKEAERLRRLLKEAGKCTKVKAIPHTDELHERIGARPRGRAIFDHSWVHQFFVDAVKDAEDNLQRIEDALSSVPRDRIAEKSHPMNIQRRSRFQIE